ncbi:MAG: S1C family serine protease [Halococcoides sp.]
MSERTLDRRTMLRAGGSALAAALAGCSSLGADGDRPTTDADPTPDRRARTSADGSIITRVYRETIPSVVHVRSSRGQGTGFVWDDGHVVTNAHVVGEAARTQLRYHDDTWTEAPVRGTDLHSDLAVLEPETRPESATPLALTESSPAIGETVLAIGNPYDLDGSVTAGIVSGLDRLIPSPAGYQIPDAIQTDAGVNPGNSGGPLVTLDGAVAGVVNSKQGDDIAFGISAALTERVVPRLIETGTYEHAYLGVSLETVTPTIAAANDLADPGGLLVVETVPSGPADGVLQESDLRIVDGRRVPVGGDVIRSIEGTPVESFEDLASYLALETRPGDTVSLGIVRAGTERTVEVTLATRPERSRSPLR